MAHDLTTASQIKQRLDSLEMSDNNLYNRTSGNWSEFQELKLRYKELTGNDYRAPSFFS